MNKYDELRRKYLSFVFDRYELHDLGNSIEVKFFFEIDGLSCFVPKWVFPKCKGRTVNLDDVVLRKLVFYLGMVELISYWKISCAPKVLVKAGFLSDEEVLWWKKQYFYGLGEFFYTNHIPAKPDDFMTLEAIGGNFSEDASFPYEFDGCLIPIGGGKDSAVTIEILQSMQDKNACYIINSRGAAMDTAYTAGFSKEQILCANRTLDANMLSLNKKGFLNGHTPFSAVVAFSSLIMAYLHGKKYVVLSNEASANESTVEGSCVNHQYSKSFEFEKDFYEYEKRYVGSGILYFSLLRPLSEFQIAKYFASKKKYHAIFKSCNAGSKQNTWCCNCPKCLFVYLILSPFIDQTELCEIFGENLLEKQNLSGIFEQLIGIGKEKPFECVGSRDEVNTAICMTIENMERNKMKLPLLFSHYKSLDLYKQYKSRENIYQNFYNTENLLPKKFEALVRKECF